MAQTRAPVRWKKGDTLPDGAVLITEEEALKINKKRLENWKPASEVWPLKHGPFLMSIASGLSGILITAHFRHAFRLGLHGFPSTLIVGVLTPAYFSYLLHDISVTDSILASNSCLICLETRSGLIQSLLGGFYSAVMSSVTASLVAKRIFSYPVPDFREPREYMKMLRTSVPAKRLFGGLLLAQFTIGMMMANREWHFFEEKMMKDMAKGTSGEIDNDISYI